MVTKGVKENYLPNFTYLILFTRSSNVEVSLVLPNKANGIEKSLYGKQKETKSGLKDLSSKCLKGYW